MSEDRLAIRPPVLEGEYIDPETARVYEQYGLLDGIRVLMHRRLEREIMREFLTGEPADNSRPQTV